MLPGLMESFIKCCDKGRGGRSTLAKAAWRDVKLEPAVKAGSAHFTVGRPAVSELIIHSSTREGRRQAVTSHAHICALAHKQSGTFPELLGMSEPVLPPFDLKWKHLAVSHFWEELQWQNRDMLFIFLLRNRSYAASKIFSIEMPSEKQWLHCPYGSASKYWSWSPQSLLISLPDIVPCNKHYHKLRWIIISDWGIMLYNIFSISLGW